MRKFFGKSKKSITPEKYGLFEFQAENSECCVDIIAVHGLGGHYEQTWASDGENPCVWLKDLLPSDIPNARILSFGYNSAVALSKSVADISTFAEQLLSLIRRERASKSQKFRPVIFVSHSLGGIVVKQALEFADQRRNHQPDCLALLNSLKGIIFMGTPHQGSDSATYGAMCADMLKAASLGASTNSALLKELKKDSRKLGDISNSFTFLGADVPIRTFVETEKMKFLNSVIVTENSARLYVPNEEVYPLNGNHSTMCKFAGRTQDYRTFSRVIVQLADDSRNSISEYISALGTLVIDPERHNYTATRNGFGWFFESPEYDQWIGRNSEILWLSGKPGDGKTALAFCLWAHLEQTRPYNGHRDIAFSICRSPVGNFAQTASFQVARILSTLIVQLLDGNKERCEQVTCHPQLQEILSRTDTPSASEPHLHVLWRILFKSIVALPSHQVIIIVDGVDEIADQETRRLFLDQLYHLHQDMLAEEAIDFKILLTSKAFPDIASQLQGLPNIQRDKERQECLRSLRFDELSARRDRVEQAIAGTGKWLADDEAFQNWEKSPHSSLLLIRGKPGSGKSTLAKHILEMKKLEHQMSQHGELDPYNPPRVLIADFFYSLRGGTKETNHTLMLQSLLFQLLSQDASLFLLFQSAYRRLRAKSNFEWPHQELKDIFSSLPSLQSSPAESRIYILVDAMDESSDRGRPEILCLLAEICSSKSDRTFKCLVASRPLPVGEIDHTKWDSIFLEQKNCKDIQNLIQSGLREVKRQPGLSTIDFQFALDYMTKHAEGVFLWVALVFRELNELALTGPSQEELEKCLRRLPIDLGEFYSLIIQRLVDKSKTNRGLPGLLEKGAKMLAWVVFAERPLKLEEFQDAVAIPSSPGTFDPSPGFLRRTRVSDIQSRINACCGPLIEIREGFVQLLHLSVREYLLLPGGAGPPFHVTQERGDAEISSCCIRYLCLIACQPQSKAITSWDNQDYDELVEWLAGFPLLSYILRYSLSYLRFACASTVSTEISLLFQLLRDNHASLSLLGHWLKTLPKFGHLGLKPALDYPQFHYRCLTSAVERRLPAVVEVITLLKEGILKGDFELLQRASCNDYADVVIMLLHHGADLNAQGGHYGNALQAASFNGHAWITRVMIDNGADLNAQGGHYGNALQAATVNGHGSMARFMIDNGADLNAQGGYYGNALQAASVNGYADVVRMLLDQGADPNAQGGHYGNALQAATSNGHSDVIQILVDHGAALP